MLIIFSVYIYTVIRFQRYITRSTHHHLTSLITYNSTMGSLTIPKLLVVDFTNDNLTPGTTTWSSTCNDIRVALENHGCFIALYNGVSTKLQESVFQAADELFDLPTETKIKNIVSKPYHGYVGQMPIVPLHEGLGIDYATDHEGAQSFTNLMWPNGNQSFW